jgi:hypothetical protein
MRILLFLFISSTCFKLKAQSDTIAPVTFKESRHEIGLGILSPFLMVVGATDLNERYTNFSYRYRIHQKHAIKAFIGNAFFNSNENKMTQERMQATPGQTVYLNRVFRTPTNFQTGLGYELILGKNKLKHVVGVDLLYNNKFTSEHTSYFLLKDSSVANGNNSIIGRGIDTGAATLTRNYDKFGANFSYNLRYEFSKKWLITSSFVMNYRFYKRRENGILAGISDFSINSLISDISLYYRF